VFGVPADPVTLGLVASLARPGGNATGINFFSLEINAKRLGIMHELLPKARRFAVLLNSAARADAEATSKALDEAARAFGVDIAFQNASIAASSRPTPRRRSLSQSEGHSMLLAKPMFGNGEVAPRGFPSCHLAHRDRTAWLGM
jgi:ABC-type uncharacterized transport system substrate-binding protein